MQLSVTQTLRFLAAAARAAKPRFSEALEAAPASASETEGVITGAEAGAVVTATP